jgi:hypothetical protein
MLLFFSGLKKYSDVNISFFSSFFLPFFWKLLYISAIFLFKFLFDAYSLINLNMVSESSKSLLISNSLKLELINGILIFVPAVRTKESDLFKHNFG